MHFFTLFNQILITLFDIVLPLSLYTSRHLCIHVRRRIRPFINTRLVYYFEYPINTFSIAFDWPEKQQKNRHTHLTRHLDRRVDCISRPNLIRRKQARDILSSNVETLEDDRNTNQG